MVKVAIICDSLRIGGVERLALDQAFALNDKESSAVIFVLGKEPDKKTASFTNNEAARIQELGVKIVFLPGSRLVQLRSFNQILKYTNFELLISHSLRGSVILFCLRLLRRHKFYLTTTIHQLPTLSAPVQRTKRMIYSQFTDKLFIFSEAAKHDWDYRRQSSLLINFLTRRNQVEVCRNGVFLERIAFSNVNSISKTNGITRLIFIGRVTAWKGLNTFLQIIQLPELAQLEVLIVTPTSPLEYLETIDTNVKERITLETGKSITQINFHLGDLLLYPANYGTDSKFVEGISINVLEMACLGIPSLITKNGSDTWPELLEYKVVKEVDWTNLHEIVTAIRSFNPLPLDVTFDKCRELIDINHNLNTHINSHKN